MKTTLQWLVLSAFCILALGCTPEITELNTPSSESVVIEISKESMTLRETFTASVSAVVRPWNSKGEAIEWSSSNSEVATVDQNGLITAISIGEAIISAESAGVVATCHVTVVSWAIPAETIDIDLTPISLKVSESKNISCIITPETTTDHAVWESNNETVATVAEDGTVTANGLGMANIYVTIGSFNYNIPVLVHGDLWIEQTDALKRPVSFENQTWEPDTIRVARGETATIQGIVYTSTEQGAVTPTVKYFASKGENTGLIVNPELYWIPEIKCSAKWDAWAGGAAPDKYPDTESYIPDPMMPVNEYEVVLGGSKNKHGIWAEFEIPRDLSAGIYEGCIAVQGTDYAEMPFVVQVYDVTLPEKQTLDIIQWINPELEAMNNGNAVTTNEMYTLLEEEILPLICRFGQNSFRAMKYDKPSIKHAVKNSDGSYKVIYDFSTLEREMNMFLRACPDMHYYQAKTGSMLVNVSQKGSGILGLRAFEVDENGNLKVEDNGDGTYDPVITYVDQEGTSIPEAEMYAKHYFSALEEFLKGHSLPDGRTWLDIFCQAVCDEPNDVVVPAYNQVAGYIKKYAPGIKTMDPLGTLKINPEVLSIPCPCIDQLRDNLYTDGYPWNDELQTRWIYSAVGPQGDAINRFIRVPLIKTRLMHWLNYRYKAVGYLHWGLNFWIGAPGGDPWKDAAGDFIGGDMFIIWPGNRTVYPSIRLAAMRDGIRDYELLKMLGETDAVKAMELCRSKATNYLTHNTDVEEFRQTRRTILELLSKTPVNQ